MAQESRRNAPRTSSRDICPVQKPKQDIEEIAVRGTLVFVSGVAFGYTLHVKKDQTIDSVVTSFIQFLEKRTNSMKKRYLSSN
jgi:hypothetical protein